MRDGSNLEFCYDLLVRAEGWNSRLHSSDVAQQVYQQRSHLLRGFSEFGHVGAASARIVIGATEDFAIFNQRALKIG